jgi:hypothetical protein
MPRTPVSAPPIQIFFPPAYGHPSVSITNIGAANLLLGSTVSTQCGGLILQPNDQIVFTHAVFPLYACAQNVTLGTTITTNAAYSQGAGTFVLTSTGTALGTGSTVQLGTALTAEYLTIGTISAATIITTALSQFDHASGVNMALVTAVSGSSVHVEQLTV